MQNRFTTNQSRAILIIAGLLVLLVTFFALYQPNQDIVLDAETESNKYKNEVNFLSALQMQVNELNDVTVEHQTEMDAYLSQFPSKMTQQKAIYNIYKMMTVSKVKVTGIKPQPEQTFFKNGTLVLATDAAAATKSAVEENPEKKAEFEDLVGKADNYEVEMTGTMGQIMKAMDWISQNKEHMAMSAISFSFDASTGKLSGTMSINYFSMNGNGVKYEEPDISGITIGTNNIFGTFQ